MSADHGWIVVPRWEDFQHRDAARQHVPTWIKLHTRLLSDEAFLQLSPARRSMLLLLWLEYARTRRSLPGLTASLSRRIAQRVTVADLKALSDAGFIRLSAGEPAGDHAGVSAGLEKRREEKNLTRAVTEARHDKQTAQDLTHISDLIDQSLREAS